MLDGVPGPGYMYPVKELPPAAYPGPANQLVNLSELRLFQGGLKVDTPGADRGGAVGGKACSGLGAGHRVLPDRSCWLMACAAIRSGTCVRKGPPSRAAPPRPLRSTISMWPGRGGI